MSNGNYFLITLTETIINQLPKYDLFSSEDLDMQNSQWSMFARLLGYYSCSKWTVFVIRVV